MQQQLDNRNTIHHYTDYSHLYIKEDDNSSWEQWQLELKGFWYNEDFGGTTPDIELNEGTGDIIIKPFGENGTFKVYEDVDRFVVECNSYPHKWFFSSVEYVVDFFKPMFETF